MKILPYWSNATAVCVRVRLIARMSVFVSAFGSTYVFKAQKPITKPYKTFAKVIAWFSTSALIFL